MIRLWLHLHYLETNYRNRSKWVVYYIHSAEWRFTFFLGNLAEVILKVPRQEKVLWLKVRGQPNGLPCYIEIHSPETSLTLLQSPQLWDLTLFNLKYDELQGFLEILGLCGQLQLALGYVVYLRDEGFSICLGIICIYCSTFLNCCLLSQDINQDTELVIHYVTLYKDEGDRALL